MNRRQWFGWVVLGWVLLWQVLAGQTLWAEEVQSSAGTGWKVGLAQVKITPEKPMWLAGYAGRTRPSEGTLDDLWVKVLALESADGHRAVFLSSDLVGFPRDLSDRIATAVKDRYQIERSALMLTVSHTHSGPVLSNALWDIYPLDDEQKQRITEYTAGLEKKMIECIGRALQSLEPAVLEAGEGECHFAVNRRNNRESEVEKLRAAGQPLKGPSDPTVPVLAIRKPSSGASPSSSGPSGTSPQLAASSAQSKGSSVGSGPLRGVVFGYACHATTLADYVWSGDYPGFAQTTLQEKYPGALALFFIGCGADQNPLPRRKVELARQYGQQLAEAVAQVLAKPMRPLEPTLATAWIEVPLGFEPPTEEYLQKLAPQENYQGRWARRLLAERAEGKTWIKTYSYPVQVWRLGRSQLWIALAGEVVVDYQIRLRQIYGPTTWVTGYANDDMAYIPSHRVWQEGGYEAGAFSVYGWPAVRWSESIETDILQAVERGVRAVGLSAPSAPGEKK